MSTKLVDLGFLEKVDQWKLHSRFFPSKVGGKPSWLVLKNLPNADSMLCKTCNQPCVFLLQVYCPINDKQRCFHRTVFLFICKNPQCCNDNKNNNFIVLRCQLPKVNMFYSDKPPNEHNESSASCLEFPNAEKYQSLCKLCGCAGNKRCSKCKSATYCCKDHQIVDWKAGHKKNCANEIPRDDNIDSPMLFPEFELVIEAEELEETPEKSESERMADYEEFIKKHKSSLPDECTINDELSKMAKSETAEDNYFHTFKKRINHEPEQVLRYQFGGTPLFVSSEKVPESADIPNCKCGQPRQFEFQIMPQLLNDLNVDRVGQSLDWGTLLVYTCKESCEPPPDAPYVREFIWKQDFTNVDSAK